MPKYETFELKFCLRKENENPPEVSSFKEVILQALIKRYLSENPNLKNLIEICEIDELDINNLEVLSEKALPEGHVDILIKEAIPIGVSRKIVIEVKLGKASENDFKQLKYYVSELGNECLRGVLIARDFAKRALEKFGNDITTLTYNLDWKKDIISFEKLCESLKLLQ